jgi:DNA-binding FadR family transcriptional regulator
MSKTDCEKTLPSIGPRKRPVQNHKKNQRKNRSKNQDRDQVANAIVNQLRNHKTVASSERQLAQMIGAKKSTVRRAVHGLAASGAVELSSSRASTTVALAA